MFRNSEENIWVVLNNFKVDLKWKIVKFYKFFKNITFLEFLLKLSLKPGHFQNPD
jgi:hypothetical protein